MTDPYVARAKAWLAQAESDARTASALLGRPAPMTAADVGCHVTALAAQAVEKSIKGAVVLNHMTPDMRHTAAKYFAVLVGPTARKPLAGTFSALFTNARRGEATRLLALTPGVLGSKSAPNTEYPWDDAGHVRTPTGAPIFDDPERRRRGVEVARRMSTELLKLAIAMERAPRG